MNDQVKRIILISTAAALLSACDPTTHVEKRAAGNESFQVERPRFELPRCQQDQNSAESPCPVSMFQLISNPERYSGLHVVFVGYVPGAKSRFILPTAELARHGDASSSVVILNDEDRRLSKGYHLLVGTFEVIEANATGDAILRQAGVLTTLDRVITSECAEDDEECLNASPQTGRPFSDLGRVENAR